MRSVEIWWSAVESQAAGEMLESREEPAKSEAARKP
jgi:hypothetical protein